MAPTEPRRTVNVSYVDGWWVVQTIKWNGTRAVWTGRAERYRELDSAVAAAEALVERWEAAS